MRVLMLADTSFATRERSLLARLEIGLADEGVRVVRVTPITPAPESLDNPYLRWLKFPEPSSALFAPLAARAIEEDLKALRELSQQDSEPIDLVHVMGDHAWATGNRLAHSLDAGIVLEVCTETALQRSVSLARSLKAKGDEERRRVCFLCPDEGVEQRLAAAAPWTNRRLATWGVHSGVEHIQWPRRAGALSVLMLGTGNDIPSCRLALDGLARLRKAVPNLLVFLDAALVKSSSALWKHAERLKLLDILSVIDDTESRRELSLQVDAMVVPERLTEHRTILLDAMAHGSIVLVRDGCPMTALRANETAKVIERGDADEWERSLHGLILEPHLAAALAQKAAAFVREHRLASAHVRGALAAYESIAGAAPMSFATGSRVG